eukprot:m.40024 g.40024  ORF g.40024 m.40024 type:complete len:212 (-) comp10385_c0_seq1:601-1236(-)
MSYRRGDRRGGEYQRSGYRGSETIQTDTRGVPGRSGSQQQDAAVGSYASSSRPSYGRRDTSSRSQYEDGRESSRRGTRTVSSSTGSVTQSSLAQDAQSSGRASTSAPTRSTNPHPSRGTSALSASVSHSAAPGSLSMASSAKSSRASNATSSKAPSTSKSEASGDTALRMKLQQDGAMKVASKSGAHFVPATSYFGNFILPALPYDLTTKP